MTFIENYKPPFRSGWRMILNLLGSSSTKPRGALLFGAAHCVRREEMEPFLGTLEFGAGYSVLIGLSS